MQSSPARNKLCRSVRVARARALRGDGNISTIGYIHSRCTHTLPLTDGLRLILARLLGSVFWQMIIAIQLI